MIKYKNLEFYFFVFIFFLAFLFYHPLPVHAESSLAINVRNQTDVYTYENFYVSNFSRVESGNVDSAIPSFNTRQMLLGQECGGTCRANCGLYNIVDNDITSSGSITRNFLVDISSMGLPENYPYFGPKGEKQIVSMRFWTHKDYAHLEFNKNYQIGFVVQKDSNLTFGGSRFLHIEITDNDNPTGGYNVDSIVDKSIRRVSIDNNHSMYVINFKFDNNKYVYPFSNFSLNNIEITGINTITTNPDSSPSTIINVQNGNDNCDAVPPGMIYNSSTEHPYYFKIQSFYFLEDGFITIDGEYVLPDNTLTDVIPDGYVSLSPKDLNIYDADVYCNPTDLMCHINNIIRNIKNVFEKIGRAISSVIEKIQEVISSIFNAIVNALKSLFLPSDDFISDFFEDQYNFLRSKLGILLAPFTIIANILNRFIDLSPNHVISFNGFTLPIFNRQLLPSFTFDFVSFFNEKPELTQLYNYYQIGVVAILYILFLSLCYKKFKSLIGGDSN